MSEAISYQLLLYAISAGGISVSLCLVIIAIDCKQADAVHYEIQWFSTVQTLMG